MPDKTNDPDQAPEENEEGREAAREMGYFPISVACGSGDPEGPSVQFVAYTAFLPREGDLIQLEDQKTVLKAGRAFFTVRRAPGAKFVVLTPTVPAFVLAESEDEDSDE